MKSSSVLLSFIWSTDFSLGWILPIVYKQEKEKYRDIRAWYLNAPLITFSKK